jgi:exopolysaccharide biosynthesis polyprenyl glycosylphosphotransferase
VASRGERREEERIWRVLESTYQVAGSRTTLPKIAPSRADLGLTDQSRQLPHRIVLVCFAGDVVVVLTCLLAAFWLRFDTALRNFGVEAPGISLADYYRYVVCGTVSLLLVLAQMGLYDRNWLLHNHSALKHVFSACLLWGAGFLSFSLFFKFQPPLSRVYAATATAAATIGLYTWRWLLSDYLQQGTVFRKLRQRILIVGWSPYAKRLKDFIDNDRSHAYEMIGCVPTPDGNFQQQPPDGVRRADSFSEIGNLVDALTPDIVLVADTSIPAQRLEALASLCEKEFVQLKVVPSYFTILVSGLHLETISGIPILGVSHLPLDGSFNKLTKRLIDIVGAIVGLLLAAPLIAIFGALVYLESPGPIFYRQRRLGRNGKTFEILKIRSMRLDAEQAGKVGWSKKDDPRRLKIGSFMRKWNIDEVPQFWNVLKGEMSLVGPRPERPELIRNFKHEIPHYNARHTVKPGITGWAQVNGLRGDTDLVERIRHDLYYVEHWNVLFDFRTMFLTFCRNKNAH